MNRRQASRRASPALVWLACVLGAAVAAIYLAKDAGATWKPEYASAPQEVRDWYQAQELTPAARARFPFAKCCDKSEVVDTKFKVSGAGNDEWWWLNEGTWQRVPDDIIHWEEVAPGGKATLFVFQGQPTCFYPPQGGL